MPAGERQLSFDLQHIYGEGGMEALNNEKILIAFLLLQI